MSVATLHGHLSRAAVHALRQRTGPPLVTFLMTVLALLPGISTVPQHGDESQYALTASYYGERVARLDFSPVSHGEADPGWSPVSYAALTQPMGTRFLYALALGLSDSPVPSQSWDYTGEQPPETMLLPRTLFMMRLMAIGCAALGLALVAARFRWHGGVAAAVLLLMPHVRADLTRAWAEAPLLLGLGLCVVAFGTRWFGIACGLAATAKLTAVGLWPLLLWRRASGGHRWSVLTGIVGAAAVWTLLTPPSWFAGGPLYLLFMLLDRIYTYVIQSSRVGQPGYEGLGGLYLPTRYLLPLELAAVLALTSGMTWWWQRRSARRTAPTSTV